MKLMVKCSYYIEVEVPDNSNYKYNVEENSCPACGPVGKALLKVQEAASLSFQDSCWACACKGENKIVSINGIPCQQ